MECLLSIMLYGPRTLSGNGVGIRCIDPCLCSCQQTQNLCLLFSRQVMSNCLWPPGLQPTRLPVHGISQARILEWVAISFSRGSSLPRDWTCVSCTAGRCFIAEPPGKPQSLSENPKWWELWGRKRSKALLHAGSGRHAPHEGTCEECLKGTLPQWRRGRALWVGLKHSPRTRKSMRIR